MLIYLCLCFLLMFESVKCIPTIQNSDFEPLNYEGSKWYFSDEVPHWTATEISYAEKTEEETFLFISTWTEFNFTLIQTTLLRMFFNRDVDYVQTISHDSGHFSLEATLYNVKSFATVVLEIEICDKTFKTIIKKERAPRNILIGNYSVKKNRICKLVIYETSRYKKNYEKGILISNIFISRRERNIDEINQIIKEKASDLNEKCRKFLSHARYDGRCRNRKFKGQVGELLSKYVQTK